VSIGSGFGMAALYSDAAWPTKLGLANLGLANLGLANLGLALRAAERHISA
jgi:hypothetical protein